jgi:TonB family protein
MIYAGFQRSSLLILVLCVSPRVILGQGGSVRGVVHDSLGGVVSSARVGIRSTLIQTTSDSTGAFGLNDIPSGDVVLEVRRLGYRPVVTIVSIRAGTAAKLDVVLAPVAEQLAPVEVRQRAEVYDSRLAGFNERKTKHVGYFVTREKLDQMSSARFIDAIRTMPGVSMRTLRGGVVTVSIRGARCAPVFYMDGFPATAGVMDLDMIDLSGVEGIEVYAGMSSIPAQFMTVAGGESCGVVAVWSRPFRPKPPNREAVSLSDLEHMIAQQTVFTADQVTVRAALLSDGLSPRVYPDSMWTASVPGRAVAEFIVGEDGRVEPGTVSIASATHPYFASAVRVALDRAVFNPALVNGKPVRQLVELPFRFEPHRSGRDSTAVSR